MAVNGKSKGSAFERKIANRLSERFAEALGVSNGFRRNPDSGSFFGGSNKSRTESYSLDYAIFGDLICPRNFTYSVECKHYKTPPSFQSVLNHTVTQWDQWLAQAEQDALSSKRKMSLVIKYNNVDIMVFLKEAIPGKYHNKYKDFHVHLLDDWLAQPDDHFLSSKLTADTPDDNAITVTETENGSQKDSCKEDKHNGFQPS
jgi:hypothetical protein